MINALDGPACPAPTFRWWPFSADLQYASVRIRGMQIISALAARGVDAALFEPREPAPRVLILAKRYDPESLKTARGLQSQGTRVVLDLCDNHFYSEAATAAAAARVRSLRDAVAIVDTVVTSTETLADVVRAEVGANCPVQVIGDAYEDPFTARMPQTLSECADAARLVGFHTRAWQPWRTKQTRLLWFGQHGTAHATGGMLDLLSIAGELNRVARQHPLALTVVSNHRQKFESMQSKFEFPTRYLPWSPLTFSQLARLHDVAVLPIQSNPFTSCKTNNRVATALLHGLAVIADPIPSYLEFSDSIFFGNWERSLATLCEQPALRRQLVTRGVVHLQTHWALPVVARQWLDVLVALLEPLQPGGAIQAAHGVKAGSLGVTST